MTLQKTSANLRITPYSISQHEPYTWLEISKDAFNHNISYYKKLIGAHNKLATVIKGNGYGHGIQQMADLCQENSLVDWICVAQLSEALILENITKPILVLGYSDVNPEYAVHRDIHFMVDNLAYAQNLNTIGKKHNYIFNVHVKIDTGLSRMGVLVADALELIQQLQQLPSIHINGIFSHFAASDSNPEFTEQQFNKCNDMLTLLDMHNIIIENIHMSNSAAISTLDYPAPFNFFRLGLGMYGLGNQAHDLQPILAWKTRIIAIKTIPTDSYVSYAGTYKTTRTTRIALLPVGYSDGYDFRFSNNSSVLINGAYVPILGRVAMNITIVDITDIPAQIGDIVTLMAGLPHIGVHDLAQMAGIANVREILTGINPSLARVITE